MDSLFLSGRGIKARPMHLEMRADGQQLPESGVTWAVLPDKPGLVLCVEGVLQNLVVDLLVLPAGERVLRYRQIRCGAHARRDLQFLQTVFGQVAERLWPVASEKPLFLAFSCYHQPCFGLQPLLRPACSARERIDIGANVVLNPFGKFIELGRFCHMRKGRGLSEEPSVKLFLYNGFPAGWDDIERRWDIGGPGGLGGL